MQRLISGVNSALLNLLERSGVGGSFKIAWSQEGEDLLLHRIFGHLKLGTYVDVGAHHPKRFSNTYFFYRRGWAGINIDAAPGSMQRFKKCRPRDVCLEVGIGLERCRRQYYIFNEPALNGFSAELSLARDEENSPYFIEKVVDVDVVPLTDVLGSYLGGKKIDFLSVDAEGLDLEVLMSNNWNRYRPKIVLAEVLGYAVAQPEASQVVQFMEAQGYMVCCKLINTVVFQDVTAGV